MTNKITKSELASINDRKEISRSYTSGEITVYWRPELCIHSANCLIGLPQVFNSVKRPWINANAAGSEEIIKTVNTCPSRALTYLKNSTNAANDQKKPSVQCDPAVKIQVLKNGPLLIRGQFQLTDTEGKEIVLNNDVAAICRCGASKKKPFCDGTHHHIGFTD
jgi:uncharacterized Fe-S cluster protein YjdI